jgi:class 3 adenylate cyclase
MEILLAILGGLGCLAMMGAMMWLMARVTARKSLHPKVLLRTLAGVRRRGLRPTLKSSVQQLSFLVRDEQPDVRPVAAPDGTVTLLFTDIENSTELNERLGDRRWLELLHVHNKIISDAVRAHGGYEVKSQGDGFMLAFSSARRAIRCATDIQRAFAERANQPLRVRIGLHSGEPIEEGGDFYGKTVTAAARVADQAAGGEILASSIVRELAGDEERPRFGEERVARLKGLLDLHVLYRVRWEPEEQAVATAQRSQAMVRS